jgi:hypothetical protein
LFIDDKKIPAGEMDNYKTLIDDMEQSAEIRQKEKLKK